VLSSLDFRVFVLRAFRSRGCCCFVDGVRRPKADNRELLKQNRQLKQVGGVRLCGQFSLLPAVQPPLGLSTFVSRMCHMVSPSWWSS
jgi:hypothetical protein